MNMLNDKLKQHEDDFLHIRWRTIAGLTYFAALIIYSIGLVDSLKQIYSIYYIVFHFTSVGVVLAGAIDVTHKYFFDETKR